jgi:GR25 family glycosyltransferase involved in LPS biosynthesis
MRDDETYLILEDDVILEYDFSNRLNQYVKQLPIVWDMFYIGSGCNLHAKNLLTQILSKEIQPNALIRIL